MGTDNKTYIPKRGTLNQMVNKIVKTILDKLPVWGDITTEIRNHPIKEGSNNWEAWDIYFALDYHSPQFSSKKEQRKLWVYYDYNIENNFVYISMGKWGHDEDISKALVNEFGGYADFNDCDDIFIDYAMPEPKKQTT